MTLRHRLVVLSRLGGAVGLASAGALAGSSALWAGSASAQTVDSVQSGWWNYVQAGSLTAPSTTPSNELQVGQGPNGPLAIAAVSFQVPSTVDGQSFDPSSAQVVLTLQVPANSTFGTPAVAACPTTSPWQPGPDQPASSAPSYACAPGVEVDGVLSSDGTSEKWTLTANDQVIGQTGEYSVALVPEPSNSSPFSIDYNVPTPDSVSVTMPAPSGSSSPSNSAGTTPSSGSDAGSSPVASTGTGSATPASGTGSAPVTVSPSSSAIPTGSAALSSPSSSPSLSPGLAAPPAASPSSGSTTPSSSANPSGASSERSLSNASHSTKWGPLSSGARKGLFIALLVALAVALLGFGTGLFGAPRLGSAPRSGGANSANPMALAMSQLWPPRVGGIGRFARPRVGPPRRL